MDAGERRAKIIAAIEGTPAEAPEPSQADAAADGSSDGAEPFIPLESANPEASLQLPEEDAEPDQEMPDQGAELADQDTLESTDPEAAGQLQEQELPDQNAAAQAADEDDNQPTAALEPHPDSNPLEATASSPGEQR